MTGARIAIADAAFQRGLLNHSLRRMALVDMDRGGHEVWYSCQTQYMANGALLLFKNISKLTPLTLE